MERFCRKGLSVKYPDPLLIGSSRKLMEIPPDRRAMAVKYYELRRK
jgi:hypothetical protein